MYLDNFVFMYMLQCHNRKPHEGHLRSLNGTQQSKLQPSSIEINIVIVAEMTTHCGNITIRKKNECSGL